MIKYSHSNIRDLFGPKVEIGMVKKGEIDELSKIIKFHLFLDKINKNIRNYKIL